MRVSHKTWLAGGVALLIATGCQGKSDTSPTADVAPKWEAIFDGKTLNGWTPKISMEPVGQDKDKTFEVVDGAIRVSYEGYDKFDDRFGHLFYKDKLSHYRLKLEYRFFGEQLIGGASWANVNSGVMLHSQSPESMELDQYFPISVEGQLLGALPDNSPRTTGNVCTPGTNVMINGEIETEHCIRTAIPVRPLGEWVQYEVEVLGNGTIKQLINGQPTFEFSGAQYDPADKRLTDLKNANDMMKNGLAISDGYIALQAESAPVEFRNIQLMRLNTDNAGGH